MRRGSTRARSPAIPSPCLLYTSYTDNLFEYTPMQIKQAVVGYGGADKHQVQMMVRMLLGIREIPKPDDAADAVACAITHAHAGAGREHFRIK